MFIIQFKNMHKQVFKVKKMKLKYKYWEKNLQLMLSNLIQDIKLVLMQLKNN